MSRIEQVHQAVGRRAFRPAGSAGTVAGTAAGHAASLFCAAGQPAGQEPAGNLALAALNAVAGDLLVQPASAHGWRGARQHIPFTVHLGHGFGGMHHFDLLNHPDVWAAIRRLLSPGT